MTSPAHFSPESLQFLKDLEANNTKDWFDTNKLRYQSTIKAPADTLKTDLSNALSDLTDREITGKIFRINRDLRFSRDKTPYNTHVRMAFWPTGRAFEGSKAQPPSFFLSIEADHLTVGAGCMAFSKPALSQYLDILRSDDADALPALLKTAETDGFSLSEPDLAKPARGFPADHPNAELARHKGLAIWRTVNDVQMIFATAAATRLANAFGPALPLWKWLVDLHEAP